MNTKGPWKENEYREIEGENGLLITRSYNSGGITFANKEIKGLILAAPEMYEALKAVEYSAVIDIDGDSVSCCPICDVWAGNPHENYCEIGKALSKAEGRPK